MSSVFIDHHRWLVNSNLFTDEIKDNIAMCGYCLLEEVKDATTFIDFNNKIITYHLLVPASLYLNLKILNSFNAGANIGFFEAWRLKKFLAIKQKNDEIGFGYRLNDIGNSLVKKYLSDEWSVKVKVFKENEHEKEDFWLRIESDSELDL